jgi:hypothetical protein
MEEKSEQKLIDIDGILYAKNPKLFKVIPKFLVSYLKRIIHQDELNSILTENTYKKAVDFMNSIMEKFKMTINVNGFITFQTKKNTFLCRTIRFVECKFLP